ncbi:hypothetical protein EC973_003151 [Apophysomyces ossiformis]|uniref:Core Histone H2A/H2B/H3 domain-containing protein n=1 Tax=Apophysomyces ossiformis TaxID=679940 RepID=A0A8H7BRI0_9FUNG|nr:hypothetical protein EC973_003151 [Apophysomyces ossiformis]
MASQAPNPQQSEEAGVQPTVTETASIVQHPPPQAAPPFQQHAAPGHTQHTVVTGTVPGGHPMFDLSRFWQEQIAQAESFDSDFKNHPLPLARIKKVMKTDQDVKMISAEAPILFAKGCEIFITELTKRAWVHAEENKRRTLQRSDIATAISKTDMCDFLIDIVPREEAIRPTNPVYDQTAYAGYYQQPSMPQYASTQIDPAAYYSQLSQLTPEQMQQYQLQLQQLAAQHPYTQPSTAQSEPTQPSGTSQPPPTSASGSKSSVKNEPQQ